MKKLILFLALTLSASSLCAQSYREIIKSDPRKAASNYLAYPTPTGNLTPTPKGYTPFYLSHYGRHGSRFLIDPKQYSRPIAILAHADSLGLLTTDGQYALNVARAMAAEAYNRYGELTHLGALQHQQIANRMANRFPEIFGDTATSIQARSTVVIRCILSMENELQELLRHNNKLKVDCDASEHDMFYMNNYKDTLVDRLRKDPAVKKTYNDWVKAHVDNRPLMHRLFNNASYADTLSSCNVLAADLFHLATIAQDSEIGNKVNLYNLFTTDELYHLWQQTNIWWYLYYGASAVSQGRMPWAQRFLVRDFVEKADSCLKLNHPSASLRFGHESVVLPLVCLLDINGFGIQTANMDSLEAYNWINTKIYPMACNVQFVFYKPTDPKSKKPILVKVLLNEEEATLPIAAYPIPSAEERGSMGIPYYSWQDVRKYLLEKSTDRYLGGDISLLPSYEKGGTEYRDSTGKAMPLLQLAKTEGGWNAIRVRLFVNPKNAPQSAKDEGVCQDINYIIPLCKQIKASGMKLMLDFHYSDTWADPSKQFIPKAWGKANKATLPDSVYAFTKRSLLRLKSEGIIPDMIQVGNEITFGMLWPYGKVDPLKQNNWDHLAKCLKNGTKACREICPNAKIIIHTEHAQDWASTFGYYNKLCQNNIDYDIIGLSYYPMWHGTIPHLDGVLDSLEADFPSKQIMIVETAGYYSHENDPWAKPDQYADLYPINPQGQAEYTRELITMLNNHPQVTGLFWWFPEENQSGHPQIRNWINRGLFDNHTGRALPAFYEFSKFKK